jgi:hypothetical protein
MLQKHWSQHTVPHPKRQLSGCYKFVIQYELKDDAMISAKTGILAPGGGRNSNGHPQHKSNWKNVAIDF